MMLVFFFVFIFLVVVDVVVLLLLLLFLGGCVDMMFSVAPGHGNCLKSNRWSGLVLDLGNNT